MSTIAKDELFLTEDEAARLIRLRISTLQNWRHRGVGPEFCKVGSRVVYSREKLLAWMKSRARTSTSDDGESTS